MNAKEFNAAAQEVFNRGLAEGVSAGQMSFEAMIGVLESHKMALFEWNRQRMVALAMLKQQQGIVKPGEAGFQVPLNQPMIHEH